MKLIPIVAAIVAALAFAAGFLVSDYRDQGTIEALRKERAELDAALAKTTLEQFQKGFSKVATVFRADRRLVARLLRERDKARHAAEETERRLAHALAKDTLDDCAAGGSWRVLHDKYRRLAREHARAAGYSGNLDGGPGVAARAAGAPRTCADAFRYAARLLEGWDALATQLRALQAAVRVRQAREGLAP